MPRTEDRQPLVLNAVCKTLGRRQKVAVTNISRNGCRVERRGLELAAGESVHVEPHGLERLLGTVRWVGKHCAGIEFDYPLHPAVVDHLCRENSAGE
jgi:hypothetical protein